MVKQGVTESTTGTMPEVEGRNISPSKESGTPESANVSPETLPKEEVERLLHQVRSEEGRKRGEVESQLREAQAKSQNLEADIADIQEERAQVQKRIEDMSSNDSERYNLVKHEKEIAERERQAKTKLREADTKLRNAEVKESQYNAWERDQLVYRTADEFITTDGQPVDFDAFKGKADMFKLNDKEALTTLAEAMGFKPKSSGTTSTEKPKLYSGITSGGQEDFSSLSPKEKIEKGLEAAKQKK